MSTRNDLAAFDRTRTDYDADQCGEHPYPLARHAEMGRDTIQVNGERLPYSVRERLLTELRAWLPTTIERLFREERAALVEDVKAAARATLAELEGS